MEELFFSLCGTAVRVALKDRALPQSLPPTYAPFLLKEMPAFVDASYRIVAPGQLSVNEQEVQQWMWISKTWRIGVMPDGACLIQLSHEQDQQWTSTALLNETFSEGTVVPWRPRLKEMAQWCISYPYDRVILSNRLAHLGGVVLHASGVRFADKAWIFCGRSGIGKTTIARLWRDNGAVLMNDDRIALRWLDGQLWAQATPWHGEDPEVNPDFVPVAGIFHLRQEKENRIEMLSTAESVSRLFATAMAPFYNKKSMEQLLAAAVPALESVSSYILEFTPDKRVLSLCRDTIQA